ncbi:MAG: hypothetical protein HSCHL_0332 [Hydrogenibacillus schlegelii]|uniref:Uncharacterized protein n=1 Tax=Hydrogenibacillus schlegelii TaxID=1484 RepID=A0A2T5GDZ8_HYDSH|nr:MAG: hypothetical protein HSCHL_0332 [Hydrogenibacillus schlegelii]
MAGGSTAASGTTVASPDRPSPLTKDRRFSRESRAPCRTGRPVFRRFGRGVKILERAARRSAPPEGFFARRIRRSPDGTAGRFFGPPCHKFVKNG